MAIINSKTTKRDNFNTLLAIIENSGREDSAELAAFISHEIELLDAKANKTSAAAAEKAVENAALAANVLSALSSVGATTVTNLMTNAPELKGMNSQKITFLLGNLVKEGKVIRTKEGRTPYYAVAE